MVALSQQQRVVSATIAAAATNKNDNLHRRNLQITFRFGRTCVKKKTMKKMRICSSSKKAPNKKKTQNPATVYALPMMRTSNTNREAATERFNEKLNAWNSAANRFHLAFPPRKLRCAVAFSVLRIAYYRHSVYSVSQYFFIIQRKNHSLNPQCKEKTRTSNHENANRLDGGWRTGARAFQRTGPTPTPRNHLLDSAGYWPFGCCVFRLSTGFPFGTHLFVAPEAFYRFEFLCFPVG
ncbi:hypothetical protein V9T40_013741 [Parthenolecanium corni]|uniref:Uncharacterized protein n=1 Tax=Parthenolecanium corni TaxID=536013 RepID=A0AAN9Y2W8_9HEMI